jgi:DNA-binding winged helix-turn-helix (wHTH) protein/predicted ATPase
MIYVFGAYELDTGRRQLRRQGQVLHIQPQVFDLLVYLVQHHDRCVSKQELHEQVWHGRFVSETALTYCVTQARKAVGDTRSTQHVIETVYGHGYRFSAPVEVQRSCAAMPTAAPDDAPRVPDHDIQSAMARRLLPLVGRDQELGLLLDRWEQAHDSVGQVVLLCGDAGMGKSRLVRSLVERLEGTEHTCLTLSGSPAAQHSPLYPVAACLQRRVGIPHEAAPQQTLGRLETEVIQAGLCLEEAVPLLAALLAAPLAGRYTLPALPASRQQHHTLDILLRWLLAQTVPQVTLLVAEDLHWMDASTLELFRLLLDQVPTRRLLMLLTCRPAFQPAWPMRSYMTRLTLTRLSTRHVHTLIARLAGEKTLPQEVVRQIVAKADGVPLFVEELTKMVLESGLLQERAGQYVLQGSLAALAMPATLSGSLLARLEPLGAVKQVAQHAAVIGREFTYALLRDLVPMDEATLQQALAQLVEAELVYQHGLPPHATYRFKHILIQDAVYATLPVDQRQQAHQRLAQLLVEHVPNLEQTRPDLLAQHYTQAGLLREAIAAWQQAAQYAMQRSAYPETIALLTTAIEVLQRLPETPERQQDDIALHLMLGKARVATQGYAAPEVGQAFWRAHTLCQQNGQTSQSFPALAGLWNYAVVRAELQTARGLAAQCVQLAHHLDTASRCEAQLLCGITAFFQGEFLAARAHFDDFIRGYVPQPQRAHTPSRPEVVGLSLAALTAWSLGYPEQAQHLSAQALQRAQGVLHPFSLAYAHVFATWLYEMLADAQTMQAHAQAARTLASEHGFPLWEAMSTVQLGTALSRQGPAASGLRHIRQGLAAFHTTGAKVLRPMLLGLLADTLGRAHQPEEGLSVLTTALEAADQHHERVWSAELHRLYGELVLLTAVPGHAAQAEASFQQALRLAQQQQAKSLELRAAMSLSRLWQQQGRGDAAQQCLADVYAWFTEGFDTADLRAARGLLTTLQARHTTDGSDISSTAVDDPSLRHWLEETLTAVEVAG